MAGSARSVSYTHLDVYKRQALLFVLNHAEYVTLLPKSITTAIGVALSEEMGGYASITVAAIVITGVLGNMFAERFLRLFGIENPVARGVAIGTSAHAVGTCLLYTSSTGGGRFHGARAGRSAARPPLPSGRFPRALRARG